MLKARVWTFNIIKYNKLKPIQLRVVRALSTLAVIVVSVNMYTSEGNDSRSVLEMQHNTIQYTVLAVNIYMCVATIVGVAGDTIKHIYIITYYTEEHCLIL
jgi:hypothetical protein